MKGHRVLTSSESDEYGTPRWLFIQRAYAFQFTLDPCCTEENRKCTFYFTKEMDGLAQSWAGHRVFVNPPYSDIRAWMRKCKSEWETHNILIDCLVPNRSDTQWYHESVEGSACITNIKGRIRFDGGAAGATFPSIFVTYMPRILRP